MIIRFRPKILLTLTVVATACFALTTSANAAPLLSVDFNDDAGLPQAGGFTAWDEGTGFSKLNVGGSGLDVTITGAGPGLGDGMHTRGAAVDGTNAGFTYANLYNDWLFGTTVDFSISGLDADTAYEVTWYSYDHDATVQEHTITATDLSNTTGDTLVFTPGSSTSGAPTTNDDYAFTGTWTSTSDTLDLTVTTGINNVWVRVNGFEISAPAGGGAVVPEPASIAIWSILGICLAGYGYRRRRRNS